MTGIHRQYEYTSNMKIASTYEHAHSLQIYASQYKHNTTNPTPPKKKIKKPSNTPTHNERKNLITNNCGMCYERAVSL